MKMKEIIFEPQGFGAVIPSAIVDGDDAYYNDYKIVVGNITDVPAKRKKYDDIYYILGKGGFVEKLFVPIDKKLDKITELNRRGLPIVQEVDYNDGDLTIRTIYNNLFE